jgi:hypothetical protein
MQVLIFLHKLPTEEVWSRGGSLLDVCSLATHIPQVHDGFVWWLAQRWVVTGISYVLGMQDNSSVSCGMETTFIMGTSTSQI